MLVQTLGFWKFYVDTVYVGALLGFWKSIWYPQHCTFCFTHVMFVVLSSFKESQPHFIYFQLVPWHTSRGLSHRPTSPLRPQTQSSIKALAFSTTWVNGKGEVCWSWLAELVYGICGNLQGLDNETETPGFTTQ